MYVLPSPTGSVTSLDGSWKRLQSLRRVSVSAEKCATSVATESGGVAPLTPVDVRGPQSDDAPDSIEILVESPNGGI